MRCACTAESCKNIEAPCLKICECIAPCKVKVARDSGNAAQNCEWGEVGIKAFGEPDVVLYDVKGLLPLGAADGRL